MKQYFYNVLVAGDQFANTILKGHVDETISARAGRAKHKGKLWGRAMARFLGWLQKDHCEGAVLGDLARAEEVERLEREDIEREHKD